MPEAVSYCADLALGRQRRAPCRWTPYKLQAADVPLDLVEVLYLVSLVTCYINSRARGRTIGHDPNRPESLQHTARTLPKVG
jgi:hypothetical protein